MSIDARGVNEGLTFLRAASATNWSSFTRDDTGRGLESQPVDTSTLFEHIEVDGYNIHRYEVEVNGISAKNGFSTFAQGIEMDPHAHHPRNSQDLWMRI